MLHPMRLLRASTLVHVFPRPKLPTTFRPGHTSSPSCHRVGEYREHIKFGIAARSPKVVAKFLAFDAVIVQQLQR